MERQPQPAVGERAGGEDDGEREEDGEHAGEGGAALADLELAAREEHPEAVGRHHSFHGCVD